MAKILVTGASGFIGLHLVRRLAADGHDVACLVRKSSAVGPLQALGARLVFGDITDLESLRAAVAGRQIVYQLAGCLRALRREELLRVNEGGLRNVAQACAEQPQPPVLVAASSLAAAGPSQPDQPRRETDPCRPVSDYGRSKLAGERAVRTLADRVPITIVRPPIVFGEGDPAMLRVYLPIWRIGVHMVPGWTPHRFSVIHAADLVELLILAAARGRRLLPADPNGPEDGERAAQGIYFAACPETPTYGELGRMIAAAMGRRRVLVIPTAGPVVWTVAGAAEGFHRLFFGRPAYFNIDKAREATAGSWVCSPQAAAEELGFSVTVPCRSGFARVSRATVPRDGCRRWRKQTTTTVHCAARNTTSRIAANVNPSTNMPRIAIAMVPAARRCIPPTIPIIARAKPTDNVRQNRPASRSSGIPATGLENGPDEPGRR